MEECEHLNDNNMEIKKFTEADLASMATRHRATFVNFAGMFQKCGIRKEDKP